jgi:hypothetical protein
MFSIRARLRCGAVAVAMALGLAGAASAQTVVISSSGPSARNYPAGKSLAAGSRIVLSAGDTLTVLDSRGTRTLRGPTSTTAEAAATTANPSFASLVATQNRRRARTGAIRGTGDAARPSNLWHVNVTAEGPVCVTDPNAVRLWRPEMESASTLTITGESGASADAAFQVGQNVAAWPTSLPIADGQTYVLAGGGLTKPTRLRFAMLPAAPSDPVGTYSSLDARGCDAQKQVLLGAMQTSE